MFDALFFDMDGTLVDSEPVWMDSIRACFAAVGITIDAALEARCAGLSNRDGIRLVLAAFPENKSDEADLARAITESVERARRRDPHVMPGADALLRELSRRGVPLALVSSSPRRLIDCVIEGQRWQGLFDVTLSTEEVGPSKPDPAVYLEALRRLGFAPAACLGIEDTMTGLRAAQAAGLMVLTVPSYFHEEAALRRAADLAFPSLEEAAPWILARCSGREG